MVMTRETGQLAVRTTSDLDASMAYINSVNPRSPKNRAEPPFVRDGHYMVRYMVPVIDMHTSEVVGAVGS